MYGVLGLDVLLAGGLVVALLVAVGARFVKQMLWPARIVGLLVLLGTLAPSCVGGVGYVMGTQNTNAAVELADAESREAMRAHGTAMARTPLYFGLGSTAVFLLGGAILLALAVPSGRPRYEDF